MKNKLEKAPVKFREDLLYFQHFMLIFCVCPKSVIITTLNMPLSHYNIHCYVYTERTGPI